MLSAVSSMPSLINANAGTGNGMFFALNHNVPSSAAAVEPGEALSSIYELPYQSKPYCFMSQSLNFLYKLKHLPIMLLYEESSY